MQLQGNPADQPTNQELCKNGKPQILRVQCNAPFNSQTIGCTKPESGEMMNSPAGSC